MCKYCEFKETELGYTGEIWHETDDAGDVCGELCIMKCGWRDFWLCTPDYFMNEKDMMERCCPMVARILYCPMCGRSLREETELQQLQRMIRYIDEKGYKSLQELVNG